MADCFIATRRPHIWILERSTGEYIVDGVTTETWEPVPLAQVMLNRKSAEEYAVWYGKLHGQRMKAARYEKGE